MIDRSESRLIARERRNRMRANEAQASNVKPAKRKTALGKRGKSLDNGESGWRPPTRRSA